ncbi:hypothetical protein [Nocardioides sp. LS1]|uniref:hypothetical protein n=1 Tax=Nocardioides sp. LS1 TaxID=1027620 RepID=UPI000F6229B6|nr:hypothetical protein [Nocardioides sp. LS1]GCD92356.1 hypothetical protein NLS1_43620 [Nocardioides sp. LS1]
MRSDVPVRATGIQLIGEMPGSGYRTPPALVRRADGQMIQLTPLLYLVLDAVDGRRTHAEIADVVSRAFGRQVSEDNVETLVDGKLRPLGVLLKGDGSEPELRKSQPLLGLRMRYSVTDPAKTNRITAPFARLFNPILVTGVVAAFCWITWWLLLDKGLASATHEAFTRPGLLLLVFAVTVLSAGFHEFGHAAAARRGGATPGVMGMGLYLFWPAFYTDVTDSYRLGRAGRIRTDLGGLYFNAIVAVGIVGVWLASGYDALLLVVATQVLQMLHQLTPMVRFDGYHVLADVTGVPDLYHRIKPTLVGALPWRWRDPEATVLKPWARIVVTAWVLVVVPMLAFSMFMMVLTFPRVVATAWVGLQAQWAVASASLTGGDPVTFGARCVAILALVVPILGMGYILTRLVRQVTTSTWRATAGRPARRAVALVTAAAVVAGLGWAWWPHPDTYRPIAAWERGTLADALPLARPAPVAGALAVGQQGRMQTVWPSGSPVPTRDHPGLAMVMVPHQSGASGSASGTAAGAPAAGFEQGTDPGAGASGGGAPSWVFPFDQPLPPGEGDTQALAVNTTDDTVTYDVAFAIVWADGDTVNNTNEAYAIASCTNCAAVAVAFQVVMIVGDADVVVPENVSAAVNYNCVQCLTYALATQLVVTLDGPLSDAGMAQLADLWAQIAEFGSHLADIPLADLQDALAGYEQQILDIVAADPAAVPAPGADPSDPGATGSASASPTSDPEASGSPTSTPTPVVPDSGSTGPSASPSESASGSPTTTASPSASPTEPAQPSGSSSPTASSSSSGSTTPAPGVSSSP